VQESSDAASDKFCEAVEQITLPDKYVHLNDNLLTCDPYILASRSGHKVTVGMEFI